MIFYEMNINVYIFVNLLKVYILCEIETKQIIKVDYLIIAEFLTGAVNCELKKKMSFAYLFVSNLHKFSYQ